MTPQDVHQVPKLEAVIKLTEDQLKLELETGTWKKPQRAEMVQSLIESYIELNQAYRVSK